MAGGNFFFSDGGEPLSPLPTPITADPPTENPFPTPDYPVLYSPDTTIAAGKSTSRDFLPLIERYRLVLKAQRADPGAYLSLLCRGITPYSSFKDHRPIAELYLINRADFQKVLDDCRDKGSPSLKLLAKESKTVLISAEQADALRAAKSQFRILCKF